VGSQLERSVRREPSSMGVIAAYRKNFPVARLGSLAITRASASEQPDHLLAFRARVDESQVGNKRDVAAAGAAVARGTDRRTNLDRRDSQRPAGARVEQRRRRLRMPVQLAAAVGVQARGKHATIRILEGLFHGA
jgi:hypothetical protein